ncbi:MAG: hypothetical protein FWG92_02390 [Leptospirales bacterium]|nr:hypothetical protein [Leptospirales bacterium]
MAFINSYNPYIEQDPFKKSRDTLNDQAQRRESYHRQYRMALEDGDLEAASDARRRLTGGWLFGKGIDKIDGGESDSLLVSMLNSAGGTAKGLGKGLVGMLADAAENAKANGSYSYTGNDNMLNPYHADYNAAYADSVKGARPQPQARPQAQPALTERQLGILRSMSPEVRGHSGDWRPPDSYRAGQADRELRWRMGAAAKEFGATSDDINNPAFREALRTGEIPQAQQPEPERAGTWQRFKDRFNEGYRSVNPEPFADDPLFKGMKNKKIGDDYNTFVRNLKAMSREEKIENYDHILLKAHVLQSYWKRDDFVGLLKPILDKSLAPAPTSTGTRGSGKVQDWMNFDNATGKPIGRPIRLAIDADPNRIKQFATEGATWQPVAPDVHQRIKTAGHDSLIDNRAAIERAGIFGHDDANDGFAPFSAKNFAEMPEAEKRTFFETFDVKQDGAGGFLIRPKKN